MNRKIPKEYLGAFKAGHRAGSREFIDEELSYQLLEKILSTGCEESKKQLAWLTKFNNEYHKHVLKKGDANALHHTPENRKDCCDRKNARNRDIISRERKFIKSIEPTAFETEDGINLSLDLHLNQNRDLNYEDTLIELLDLAHDSQRSTKN